MSKFRKFKVHPLNVRSFLPEHTEIKVKHLHQGNDPIGVVRSTLCQSHGNPVPKYVTVATIYRYHNEHKADVALGIAVCNEKDNPSRQIGWRIAVGRALKEFHGRATTTA